MSTARLPVFGVFFPRAPIARAEVVFSPGTADPDVGRAKQADLALKVCSICLRFLIGALTIARSALFRLPWQGTHSHEQLPGAASGTFNALPCPLVGNSPDRPTGIAPAPPGKAARFHPLCPPFVRLSMPLPRWLTPLRRRRLPSRVAPSGPPLRPARPWLEIL